MLTFRITLQRYKGRQSKKLYIKNKMWQNGNNQLCTNIHIIMTDRTTTI